MKRLQQRQTVEIFCSLLLSRIAEIFFLSISILWYNIIIIIKNTFFYLAFFFLLIFSPVYCLLDFAHFVRNERADLRSFSRITTFCKKKTSKFKYQVIFYIFTYIFKLAKQICKQGLLNEKQKMKISIFQPSPPTPTHTK